MEKIEHPSFLIRKENKKEIVKELKEPVKLTAKERTKTLVGKKWQERIDNSELYKIHVDGYRYFWVDTQRKYVYLCSTSGRERKKITKKAFEKLNGEKIDERNF